MLIVFSVCAHACPCVSLALQINKSRSFLCHFATERSATKHKLCLFHAVLHKLMEPANACVYVCVH